ncbi:HesB/YadR/YfhF family protein [Paenibacillus lemnae]|uniref:HesB/YadR/YfhF family protein n=1 Tax=Paenibacillus lemnae TaxID=1330551 RepID=A0A848M850_PAELE|nr:HesB/YadR/YfhF family protein [Paenibacillus lemnae]NMO96262.1 hypothetical protein [Paenibacillus lemnae]
MMIHVSQEAAQWFIKELDLQPGDSVRFFPRYSSSGGLHPGFSLGLTVEDPQHPGLVQESDKVMFYMEDHDLWYLRGYDLTVKYEESLDDISYIYKEDGAVH